MNEKIVRIPHDSRKNYDSDFVAERRAWLTKQTGSDLLNVSKYSIKSTDVRGNIENFIGVAQVPLGVVGPLKINGQFAKGTFYVPLATTEGALISTYQRGAIAITKAGGAKTVIINDENYLDPVFILKNLEDAQSFVTWTQNNYTHLSQKVQEVTKHGLLRNITPFIMGRRVILKFSYFTHDAMGANMINIATDRICRYIADNYTIQRYLLRSNLSSEKKASAVNLLFGYGKEVLVEAVIPRKVVSRHLNSSPEEIGSAWHSWALGCFHSGMLGCNAQLANGLAAIYIACGQDVAHITNASVGFNMLEVTKEGDLYASLKLPNILVGTVGGGTALGTQKECLELIDCYGAGKSKKFSEIIGATLLAGEIGICAGITSDEFLEPHERANIHTKAKAYLEQV